MISLFAAALAAAAPAAPAATPAAAHAQHAQHQQGQPQAAPGHGQAPQADGCHCCKEMMKKMHSGHDKPGQQQHDHREPAAR